jgi:hypothetical protein
MTRVSFSGWKSRRDTMDLEDMKISKDHEEELVFFVIFVGFRAFVVAF